jgi:double zinc ribbon protein
MFCPRCKAEYRPGFTQCSDCGVPLQAALVEVEEGHALAICPSCRREFRDGAVRCSTCDVELVDRLPGEPLTSSEAKRAVSIYNSHGTCADACLKLRQAGIAFEVRQQKDSRSRQMNVSWEFTIFVRASEYENAKKALELEIGLDEIEAESWPDEDEIRAIVELPAEDGVHAPGASEVLPDWDPKNWPEEEATVEIWSGEDGQILSVIEMSLRESYIHSRMLPGVERQRRVFVLPQDESRAGEIIRQIVDARSVH